MLIVCVEKYERKISKTLDGEKNLGEWMEGRMDGKAGLRIAYSNQKETIKKTEMIQKLIWPNFR